MRLGRAMKRIGLGRKMAVYGFAAQAAASLVLGLILPFGEKATNVAGTVAGVLTVAGFVVAMAGFFLMYYARRKKQHLIIGFLMLVYLLVNFMLYDPTLVQLLLSLAYTGVMLVSAVRDRDNRTALIVGAALALYAVAPLTLGRLGLPALAVGMLSGLASACCSGAAAVYAYKG